MHINNKHLKCLLVGFYQCGLLICSCLFSPLSAVPLMAALMKLNWIIVYFHIGFHLSCGWFLLVVS